MRLLFVLQDEGSGALWIWLIIILIPALGRLAGWVIEKLSGKELDPAAKEKKIQARREQAKRLEQRGQEMWKRLLEGEEQAPEAPGPPATGEPGRPEPRPATAVPTSRIPAEDSAPRPALTRRLPHDELPSTDRIPTLERRLVGTRPSERMPEVLELEQHRLSDRRAQADMQADEEVNELARVQYLQALGARPGTGAEPGTGFELPRGVDDWRRAVVWSEVLRPPVALRDPANEDLPALR